MDITYLGRTALKVKSRGTTLITNPFGLKAEADLVICSRSGDLTKVVATKTFIGPGEYEASGISLIAYGLRDCQPTNTIFVIEAEGLRVAHLGFLNRKLTEKEIQDLGEIDILMLPVGGGEALGAKEAVEVVQAIEPVLALPMHFGPEDGLSPVEDFLKLSGMAVEKMDKLTVKIETLGETEKIILLSK
jgi:L-ascorbate metabolism protein UlaG (beta-lactamase superfamily)